MSFWEQIFISTPELHIAGFILRGVFAFIFLAFLARMMGPTEVGEFTTVDFIVAITIGSIASAALVDSQVHFFSSLLNMALWAFLLIMLNFIGIRFPNFRRIIVGGPLVLVRNGKVLEKNLFRAKLNFDDLMSALRLKDAPLLEDVEYAVLEPKGDISVIKKSQKQSLTPEDLKIIAEYQGMPTIVLINGKILHKSLELKGFTENWLRDKLFEMGVENPEAVSVAQVDSNGNLYVDLYDDKKDRPKSTKEKELILTLEKVYAELDTFSRETGNEENGKLFSQYADQTGAILSELKTRLLKAEEMKE
ncbi:MAG: DUF421 domain-containing protein [Firmicutes bacterium]|jgi:uncharacterized membrane protein YcaP (DUF421 family)|nr:DUF421 domain-containing protein [Bacillota bacterium]